VIIFDASAQVKAATIRFPLGRPVPYDLVKRIVAYRVKERKAEESRRA